MILTFRTNSAVQKKFLINEYSHSNMFYEMYLRLISYVKYLDREDRVITISL